MSPSIYQELGVKADSIRLMNVKRDSAHHNILSCSLKVVRLRDVRNSFFAVSHPWGKEAKSFKVLVNGSAFFVSPQLWQFLHLAAERLAGQQLWTDAICIDQRSTTEKERQIPLMGQIYSETRRLIAWLPSHIDGHLSHAEHTDPNLSAIQTIARSPIVHCYAAKTNSMVRSALMRLKYHDYWSRLWIVQELRLSKRKEFW